MSETDSRLHEFVELFNSKEYFEAHEILESLWIETEGPDKNFYKGLIQCAVAFVHLERANYKGAHKLFGTACHYLQAYLPEHQSIQTETLLEEFEEFFARYVPDAEHREESMELIDYDTPVIVFSES